jgi:hypothetical protein
LYTERMLFLFRRRRRHNPNRSNIFSYRQNETVQLLAGMRQIEHIVSHSSRKVEIFCDFYKLLSCIFCPES